METLNVYLNDIKVGVQRDDNGRMDFTYSGEYLSNENCEPLSHSLPIRKEPYQHAEIEPVLSNLLPDDIIRHRIAQLDTASDE